jgi:hypothetical protein
VLKPFALPDSMVRTLDGMVKRSTVGGKRWFG